MTRLAIVLVVSILVGGVSSAHATDLSLGRRARVLVLPPTPVRAVPLLVPQGFPALRSDGQMVAAFAQSSDYGDGTLLLIDVATASVAQRIEWPQHSIDEEQMSAIDRPGLRAIRQLLAQGRYRSLAGLARMAHESDDEGQLSRFESPSRDIVVSSQMEFADYIPKVSIVMRGGSMDRELSEQAELSRVLVSPNLDFVILEQMFCACHCSTSPVLARVH